MKISIVAVIAVAVLVAAGQLVAPKVAAKQIEDRLTKQGGTAHADVNAFPWPRLLFKEGSSLKVTARRVQLPLLNPGKAVLSELDGFNKVDLAITDSTAGPMKVTDLTVHKNNGPYELAITGTVTPSDVASFLTGFPLPFATQPVPIDVTATLRSDNGKPQAVVANGTVAGLPAGPLVEALAQALAARF